MKEKGRKKVEDDSISSIGQFKSQTFIDEKEKSYSIHF